jgi:hypothetical protein
MKKTIFLPAILLVLITISCGTTKEKTADELLNDPKTETEIYESILNDSTHLIKLMDKMTADENCKKIMNRNSVLFKMVCLSEKMDSLISTNKQATESLSHHLIKINGTDSFMCDKNCTKTVEGEFIRKYSKRKHVFKK